MSLLITLPEPVEARLQTEAARAGVSTNEYAAELLTKSLPASTIDPEVQKRLNAPSMALLQSWLTQAETPRTADEIAGAEKDLEDLMRNLNAPRREAGERLHFPDIAVEP